MSKKPEPEQITLTFDLYDLPTAQHRAGLAGLVLQIDSMGQDGSKLDQSVIPKIEEVTPSSATITFTRESMQGLFDNLYAAKTEKVAVTTKWQGTPPLGETSVQKRDPKTGEMKEVRAFIYEVVKPLAPCLKRHLQPEATAWLALWQQMIWEIPRGGNNVRSRAPFLETAADKPCGEGAKAWSGAVKLLEKRARSQFETEQISGALLLGAQAYNAEGVPFSGRVDHNLLLHFWQVVVLAFAPRVVDKKEGKAKRLGFVLAIPDVGDIGRFRRHFPRMLGTLSAGPSKALPPSAQIDHPGQAGLEILLRMKGGEEHGTTAPSAGKPARRGHGQGDHRRQIQSLAMGKAVTRHEESGVHAVESYHMAKLGNNVKMLSFTRVNDHPGLTEEYSRIGRIYRNPLFRAARLRALVDAGHWHSRMIELFAEYPSRFFVEREDTPRFLPRFGRDANEQLHAFQEDLRDMKTDEMEAEDRLKHLGIIVRKLIDAYVIGRAESKTGLKAKTFERKPIPNKPGRTFVAYPDEFREAQQRICSDAFLAMRSRHDQDFVEYFTGSVCSVAQFLSSDEYEFLVQTLMTRPDPSPLAKKVLSWEDIKAMAMIAVSACAYRVRPRDTKTSGRPS